MNPTLFRWVHNQIKNCLHDHIPPGSLSDPDASHRSDRRTQKLLSRIFYKNSATKTDTLKSHWDPSELAHSNTSILTKIARALLSSKYLLKCVNLLGSQGLASTCRFCCRIFVNVVGLFVQPCWKESCWSKPNLDCNFWWA